MIDRLDGIAAHALNVGVGIIAGFFVICASVLFGHGTAISVLLGLAAGLAAPAGGAVYACTHRE